MMGRVSARLFFLRAALSDADGAIIPKGSLLNPSSPSGRPGALKTAESVFAPAIVWLFRGTILPFIWIRISVIFAASALRFVPLGR